MANKMVRLDPCSSASKLIDIPTTSFCLYFYLDCANTWIHLPFSSIHQLCRYRKKIIRPKISCGCLFPELSEHWPYKYQDRTTVASVLPGERGTSIRNLSSSEALTIFWAPSQKAILNISKRICKYPLIYNSTPAPASLLLHLPWLVGQWLDIKQGSEQYGHIPSHGATSEGSSGRSENGRVGTVDRPWFIPLRSSWSSGGQKILKENMLYNLMGALKCLRQTVNQKDRRDNFTWEVRSWKTSRRGVQLLLFSLLHCCFSSMPYKQI